jgi:hypothetical protein
VQNLADRRFDLYRIEWDKRVGNITDAIGEQDAAAHPQGAKSAGATGHAKG